MWEGRVAVLIGNGYNGTHQIQPQTAPSPSTITIPSNTPISRPIPLTTPNGIGSNQPFCHNTLSGQIDGLGDSCVPKALTLYYIDSERCANK